MTEKHRVIAGVAKVVVGGFALTVLLIAVMLLAAPLLAFG